MKVRIKAELVTGRDLRPGDLFSAAGPSYWDTALDKGSVGEAVYIRTHINADRFHDANDTIYRITIVQEPDPLFTKEQEAKFKAQDDLHNETMKTP